jgi:hypothetical protein
MGDRGARILVALALAVAAVACTRTVALRYEPPGTAPAPEAAGLVTVEPFRDRRQNGAHQLGRVRGVFGTALKRVETEETVAAEVTRVFEQALAVRGLLASGSGPITLRGEIRKLDCNHYWQREAHATLALQLVDARGRVLLEGVYESDLVGGGAFTGGVFASRRGLAALAERALVGSIDAALSDPAFVLAATGTSTGRAEAPLERPSPAPSAAPLTETEKRLRALQSLYEQGRLSEDEYARRRAKLLGAL